MGTSKKRKLSEVESEDVQNTSVVSDKTSSYEEKLNFVSEIAKPMASRKLTKKLYKLVKKSSKHKTYLRNGLKDVQSHIRKGERGIVVLAGNVTPIDVMCHIPGVCEDHEIPYAFTPSREDLGTAMGVKRSCLMVMIREHEDYKELYDECFQTVKALPSPLSTIITS